MGKRNQVLSLFVASFVFIGLIVSGLPVQTQAAPYSVTIYSADFSNEGDGFPDHTTSSPPATGPASTDGGVATAPEGRWTVSYQIAPSTDTTANEFSVNSGVMRIQDWGDTEGRWESFEIDVSGVSTIDISAEGVTIGDSVQNGTSEFFTYFYTLDSGTDVSTVVPLSGDTAGTTVSYSIIGLDVSAANTLTVGFKFLVDGAGDGYEISTFTVEDTTGDEDNTPPTIQTLNPADDATGVTIVTNLVATFDENIQAGTGDIVINEVGGSIFATIPVSDAQVNIIGATLTIDPTSDLDSSQEYEVVIASGVIEDIAGNEFSGIASGSWSFTTIGPAPDVIINEVDADTESTDTLEFVELYSSGSGNIALDGLVLVFYNGNGDVSYFALDLDGYQTDANGYFVIGNSGVANVDFTFDDGALQNGVDAVVLYQGDSIDFPNGTAVTTANLIDAIVYDTGDPDDAGLLVLLNTGQPQVDEDGNGNKDFESNQRCPNGAGGARNTSSYIQGMPSPGITNSACPGETAPTVSSTAPSNSASGVVVDSNIVINFSEDVGVAGSWYNIDCPSSGIHTAVVSGGPQSFTLNPDSDFATSETCIVTIYASQVTDLDTDDPPDAMEADYAFSFATEGSPPACSTIPQIQGTGNTSPCLGHRDDIEGCITGVTATGIYFQDLTGDGNPVSSDGIFAYFWSTWENPSNLQPGDLVNVSGTVTEYYDTTEFANSGSDPLSVSVTGSCTVPSPVSIASNLDPTANPMTLYERYEGMRVQMTFGGWVVGPTKRFISRYIYGDPEIAFVDFGSTISDYSRVFQSDYPGYQGINYLSGGLNFDLPELDFGDDIAGTNITGVLGYQFDKYTLLVDASPTLATTDNPNTIQPQIAADDAKVEFDFCYYNVENLFDNLDDSSGDWGDWAPGYPDSGTPAGAAEYQAHLNENAAVLFNHAKSCMVIGLEEVEGKQDIYDDLATALSGLDSAHNWTGIYVESGDARDISQGFLYRDDVTLVSGPNAVSGTPYTNWASDGVLDFRRVPAAATFRFFAGTAIEVDITAYAVHFKSKGSSATCSTPDCTDVRELEAADLRDILAHHQDSLEYAVAGGDFNDYIDSSPIGILNASSDIHNLFTDLPANEQYSYIFNGESEVLDYIFVTQNMLFSNDFMWDRTFNPIHVNADFPASEHASDHDPVRVRFLGSDLSDLAASYGEAWHTIPHLITLGNSISNDTDSMANSDDASDTGVSIVSGIWKPGQTVVIQVDVQADASYPNSTAWFSGWFDWNLNGTFESSERTINQAVNFGLNNINFSVPSDAQIGIGGPENANMPVRFRLYESTIEPLSAPLPVSPLAAELTGGVAGGEVEDYVWGFTPNAISLLKFWGQANPMDWMPSLMIFAGFGVVSLWGWRRYRKEQRTA